MFLLGAVLSLKVHLEVPQDLGVWLSRLLLKISRGQVVVDLTSLRLINVALLVASDELLLLWVEAVDVLLVHPGGETDGLGRLDRG